MAARRGQRSRARRWGTISAPVHVRTVVTTYPPEGDLGEGHSVEQQREWRTVRYALDWETEQLAAIVAKAAVSKGGRARFGPVTVHVHPADRVTPERVDVVRERGEG